MQSKRKFTSYYLLITLVILLNLFSAPFTNTLYATRGDPKPAEPRSKESGMPINRRVHPYDYNHEKFTNASSNQAKSENSTSDSSDKSKSKDDKKEKDEDLDKKFGRPCTKQTGQIVGFFLCPLFNMIVTGYDNVIHMVSDSLKWTILVNNTEAQKAWLNILAIANVTLAIAFIVVLCMYTLNTGNALRAYDAKKLLSRLILVAVAINLSYYICGALADLSNIAGVGIYDLLGQSANGDIFGRNIFFAIMLSSVATIGTLIIALLNFSLAFKLILLVLTLISLRQAALLMLIIVSPLAFACYLLPNTEKWYKQWLDWYIKLLLVFPFFTATAGATQILAPILYDMGGIFAIMVPIILAAPVFIVIPIFKMAGGLMSLMTNQADKMTKPLDKMARKNDRARRQPYTSQLHNKALNFQNKNSASTNKFARFAGKAMGVATGTRLQAQSAMASSSLQAAQQKADKNLRSNWSNRANAKRNKRVEAASKSYNETFGNQTNGYNRITGINADQLDQLLSYRLGANATAHKQDDDTISYSVDGNDIMRYMSLSGNNLNGAKLSSTDYSAVLDYAKDNGLLHNLSDLNTAALSVSANGDTAARQSFVDNFASSPDKGLFMTKADQKEFANGSGKFSPTNMLGTEASMTTAFNKARANYVKNMSLADYGNLDSGTRTDLVQQIIEGRDSSSLQNLRVKNDSFIKNAAELTSMGAINDTSPTTHRLTNALVHTRNIQTAFSSWSTTGKLTGGNNDLWKRVI